jgi:hypothetical protein
MGASEQLHAQQTRLSATQIASLPCPGCPYRFVNVAEWASTEDFQAAHDAGFHALVSQPIWANFRSTPALYEVVHQASSQR